MKRVFALLIVLLSFCAYSTAQNNYTEMVYLKNGSIIRGIVVEQVPNVSLKIKTADGSIFAYPMRDVEKITKEESTNTTPTNSYKLKKQKGNTLKGYKGFVDAGYIFDLSDLNANKFEVSTSHGYQFNNYLFLGGGVGINYFTDKEFISVPVFANFRANFTNKKIAPFGDLKVGYSAGDVIGAYVSTAIGIRFALPKKMALNLQLVCTVQDFQEEWSSYTKYGSSYYSLDATATGFGLKAGFEF